MTRAVLSLLVAAVAAAPAAGRAQASVGSSSAPRFSAGAVPLPPPPPGMAARPQAPDLHARPAAAGISPGAAASWSLLLPGSGQIRSGRTWQGIGWGAATALSLGATVFVGFQAEDARRIYDRAAVSAREDARNQLNDFLRARNALLLTTAGIWALNVVDAWLFHPAR
jgi:hypothetical protein